MKRVFAFALLAGIVAVPSSALLAQAGPAAAAPAPAQQNIVQDGQPRGALGNLVSGAPSVANVQPDAGAPVAAPAAAAPAVAGQAVTSTSVVAGQATVATAQTAAVATSAGNIHEQMFLTARVMQHSMNRTAHDRFLAGQPMMLRGMYIPTGFPFFPMFGDLELQGVGMIADATPTNGPMYRVTFRNNSRFLARNFQISLIAVIGKLGFDSPVVTVEVPEVAAGAIGTMDIQFPIAVMTMGPKDGVGPFDTLLVALDSFNELPETNELNNVLSLVRTNITVVETAVTTGVAATTTTVAPAAGGVAAPAAAGVATGVAAPAPAAAAPVAPVAPAGPAAPAAPAEGVAPQPENVPAPAPMTPADKNLDNIPLDNVEGTSALFTR